MNASIETVKRGTRIRRGNLSRKAVIHVYNEVHKWQEFYRGNSEAVTLFRKRSKTDLAENSRKQSKKLGKKLGERQFHGRYSTTCTDAACSTVHSEKQKW